MRVRAPTNKARNHSPRLRPSVSTNHVPPERHAGVRRVANQHADGDVVKINLHVAVNRVAIQALGRKPVQRGHADGQCSRNHVPAIKTTRPTRPPPAPYRDTLCAKLGSLMNSEFFCARKHTRAR